MSHTVYIFKGDNGPILNPFFPSHDLPTMPYDTKLKG